jgi:hypothetical protein
MLTPALQVTPTSPDCRTIVPTAAHDWTPQSSGQHPHSSVTTGIELHAQAGRGRMRYVRKATHPDLSHQVCAKHPKAQ